MKEFVDFIVARQKIYLAREAGKPWPWSTDPVFMKAKINNCFRVQDKFSKYELKVIKNLSFEKQVFAILLLRHTIAIATYELLASKPKATVKDLVELQAKIGSGDAYINTCIQFPNKPGFKRDELVIQHHQDVLQHHKAFAAFCQTAKTPEAVVGEIKRLFPRLGPFRTYEVYTSLTYCKDFKFTEDDYLFIGPGSFDVLVQYAGGTPSLLEAQKLAARVGELVRKQIKIPPYTVRALEDSFCEFRKYKKAQVEQPSKPYYPHFYPRMIRCNARGDEKKTFVPYPRWSKSDRFKLDLSQKDLVKKAALCLLPAQALAILAMAPSGTVMSYSDFMDLAESKKETLATRQPSNVILRYYFDTLIDLKFIVPMS